MIYFDGQTWRKNRYKITYQAVAYGDYLDGFPADAKAEEVVLTLEQETRLQQIQGREIPQSEALVYVLNGIGAPPDNRTEVDRLIDMISNLTPAILEMVPHWIAGEPYPKGHYVRRETAMYKVTKPHKSETPPEVSAEYIKVYEV